MLAELVLVVKVATIGIVSIYVIFYLIISFFKNVLALPSKESSNYSHAFITGGSSGIGLELAKLYLRDGLKVTIVARNSQKLQEAVKECEAELKASLSDRLFALSCDVSSSQSDVANKVKEAVQKFGPVDILVNCAGVSFAGEFETVSQQEFERLLKINVLGSVFPTQAIVPSMKERRKGKIVFVSSQVGQAAIHGYTAYAASKWALRGMAEALQHEVKPFNIDVSVSYPPDTDTPGYKEEMLSKPEITKIISETGAVFSPKDVAQDIKSGVQQRHFSISNGVDGYLLKQLHPGMSPVNNAAELLQQVLCASLFRLVAAFYLFYWDWLVHAHVRQTAQKKDSKKDN